MGCMSPRASLASLAAAAALGAALPAAAGPPIEDDYPRALAEARRLNAPILIDVWAPW